MPLWKETKLAKCTGRAGAGVTTAEELAVVRKNNNKSCSESLFQALWCKRDEVKAIKVLSLFCYLFPLTKLNRNLILLDSSLDILKILERERLNKV